MQDHRVATPADCNEHFFRSLATVLEKLHTVPYKEEFGLPKVRIVDQIAKFRKLSLEKGSVPLPDAMHEDLMALARGFDAEDMILCHRDLAWENILMKDSSGTDLLIIDFEYAGFAHYLWEYASFILESGINADARALFARICGITSPEDLARLRHMEMLVDYTWGQWGYIQGYFDYSQIKLKRLEKHYAEYAANATRQARRE